MKLVAKNKNFFGLDLGLNSIRMVQLNHSQSKNLVHYSFTPVSPKLMLSESKTDRDKIISTLKDLYVKSGINTKNVAVGIHSNKVFNIVVDIDRLKPAELSKTIQYQADSFIPTSINDSIIDWSVLGDSPKDKNKVEVLLTSTTKNYANYLLDLVEMAGLNVIALEPVVMAFTRSLVNLSFTEPEMIFYMDLNSTDLVMLINNIPRIIRTIPVGSSSLVNSIAQNLNIEISQAEQYLFKFGADQDKLDGQIFQSITSTIDSLFSEVEKSINFFYSRYEGIKFSKIIVAGFACIIPQLPILIANRFNLNVELGNSWGNVNYDLNIRTELMSYSYIFSVASGLAQRQT